MSGFPTKERIDGAVRALHASDALVYIAATGACGGLLENLWRMPGASNTVLGYSFLYDQRELDEFIRRRPRSYADLETAFYMSAAAYSRARKRAIERGEHARPVVGLAVTAAVDPVVRRMRGDHRAYVVARDAEGFRSAQVVFEKGVLGREREGRFVDLLALNALVRAAGLEDPYLFEEKGVDLVRSRGDGSSGLVRMEGYGGCLGLHLGRKEARRKAFHLHSDTYVATDGAAFSVEESRMLPETHLVYPGSFDPLHSGHEAIAEEAERMTGRRVVFQLTDGHPDKGENDAEELGRRLGQFAFRWPALVMRKAPLFIDKARRLPGYGFLIGADAVYGLLNSKYYGSEEGMEAVMDEFVALGTTFHVAGRVVEGRYRTLDDVPIPAKWRDLFRPLSFRMDVSSTQLRNG